MNDLKNSRFKSYIEDAELENISLSDEQKTKLLDGEVLICEAVNVVLYAPLSDRKKWKTGILSVTTFKLSFVCPCEGDESNCHQQNLLLGPNEVCLSSIDAIYQIGERSKKKLNQGHNISTKVKELQIVCKNMRTFHFSFKFSDKDSGKNVTNAVLYHSAPKRQSLLFAFEYKEPYESIVKDVQMFHTADDWRRELNRTRCKNWRVCVANENFGMSPCLPQALIVPESVSDDVLQNASRHFRSRYCPVWVWGTSRGAALVRMADLELTITDRTQENVMLEHIRRSHCNKKSPVIMDLTKDCPTAKEIQSSFVKLRELCIPDNIRLFKTQDSKFYSLLENSKWLHYVSLCLSKALKAAIHLSKRSLTVVLQEGNGRDMNCVISSLTQLILDPNWRTMSGFQSLIQKEWVILGHPFCDRLGFIKNDETEQAPYFLLFLDCVWQLTQQFPRAFMFSEIYLITLWDSTQIAIFDTFVFNCEHDREVARRGDTSISFRNVWDWNEQFSEKDKQYFCNPLFDDSYKEELKPQTSIPILDVWCQCYFRWVNGLEIKNGGRPQIDLSLRIISCEIHMLRQRIRKISVSEAVSRTKEEMLLLLQKVNGFFPFSQDNGQISGMLQDNDLYSVDGLDTQSILNLTNE